MSAARRMLLDHRDGSDASPAGVNRSSKGPVDQARRLVIRLYVSRLWGLPGGGYREAAARLTAAGYPSTEQDFKNALRAKGGVPENVFAADAAGLREFLEAAVSIWPGFEWWRMVQGTEPDYLRKSPELRRVEVL